MKTSPYLSKECDRVQLVEGRRFEIGSKVLVLRDDLTPILLIVKSRSICSMQGRCEETGVLHTFATTSILGEVDLEGISVIYKEKPLKISVTLLGCFFYELHAQFRHPFTSNSDK